MGDDYSSKAEDGVVESEDQQDTFWSAELDHDSGHTYYINSKSGETQWEVPKEGYRCEGSDEVLYDVQRAVTPAREQTSPARDQASPAYNNNDISSSGSADVDEKTRKRETAASENLHKFTDASQNFVTDEFCAQILTGDMDPREGRQMIEDLRQALQRKREKELIQRKSGKGEGGKKLLQDLGQVIQAIQGRFSEIDPRAIVPVSDLRKGLLRLLQSKGFCRENTVFANSICTEDQVRIFRKADFLPFGGPQGFKMGGLGGIPACGQMGMFILSGLCPEDDGRLMIQYGTPIGIDNYGDIGTSVRKDDRCNLGSHATCPTFCLAAKEEVETELAEKRKKEVARASRRRNRRSRERRDEGKRGDASTTGENEGQGEPEEERRSPDEFSQQFEDLKGAIENQIRGIRNSADPVKRTIYGVFDEIRNSLDGLVKWLFDNKRLEAQEFYMQHKVRFDREERYRDEDERMNHGLNTKADDRATLESRDTVRSSSSRGSNYPPTSALSKKSGRLSRLQELEIEFGISCAMLGAITVETPPPYPNFAIVQHFEIFMADGDRRDYTGRLLQAVEAMLDEDSEDSEDSEETVGSGAET